MVEQISHKNEVTGSNPVRSTKIEIMKKLLLLFLVGMIISCEPPLVSYRCKVEKCWPAIQRIDTIDILSDHEPITRIYYGQPVLFYHQSGPRKEYIIGVCSVEILERK